MDSFSQDMGRTCVAIQTTASTKLKGDVCESKKRKRETDEQPRSSDLFNARVLSTTTTNPAVIVSFSHISTILRAHLPLSWLSTNPISNIITPGTVFEATINSVSHWGYQILIARHEPNGALHVIEKIERDVYVCHPLQAWVTSKWVQEAALGAAPMVDLNLLLKVTPGQSHSRQVSSSSASSLQQLPTAPSSPKHPQNRRGILARKSILEKETKPQTQNEASCSQSGINVEVNLEIHKTERYVAKSQVTQENIIEHSSQQQQPTLEDTFANTPATAEDHPVTIEKPHVKEIATENVEIDQLSAEYLRKRFLETLYLCKTTLAFYAKGPLSRTRARMRVPGSSVSSEQLATRYRDIILTTKKMDLKYKESIKNRIMTLAQRHLTDMTEEDSNLSLIRKPRKTRKTKLGKDALWSIEEELIEQWWRKREYKRESTISADGQAAEMRDALAQLRMRETELQIILILEVMALETKDSAATQVSNSHVPAGVKIESVEPSDITTMSKAIQHKKKRDLGMELDDLLDRLCIWHTVGIDEHDSLPGVGMSSGHKSSVTMKDRLRDFCKDVVVPFYGSKLPDQCKAICKKLGGPEISSQRPVPVGAARPPPGTAIQTRKPHTNKRTLERVLSEDQGVRHFSPPTFSRSSTLPVAPTFRRESSERPVSRGKRQKSISFSNREIDLVADANVTAAKRRKLEIVAAQKRELDAAIEALKKPNRSMFAKDFMDDIENRTSDKTLSIKRIEPIQIRATPRHDRFRLGEEEYDLPPLPFAMPRHTESVVPSSAKKQRETGHLPSQLHFSAKKKTVLSAISDTPQRPHLQHWNSAGSESKDCMEPRTINSQSSSTLVTSTPARMHRHVDLDKAGTLTPLPTYKIHKATSSTSTRTVEASTMAAFKDIPSIPRAAGRAMDRVMMRGINSGREDSIYDTLGWNDDSDT